MTDLKKLSDEELDKKLVYNFKYYPGEEKHEIKLLRRLSEGRKATEVMGKIVEIYEDWTHHDIIGEVEKLLDDYQKGARK